VSIFGSIINTIFHHSSQAQAAGTTSAQASQSATGTGATQPAGAGRGQPAPGATQASGQAAQTGMATQAGGAQPLRDIDVEAVLEKLAASKGGGGNWRTSIVDLLKLLGLDSSLAARKQLASELDVHAGADGSAEENIALQKAVMRKLAENGGKVPDSLRH
jgi:uncharacterized protein DUF3597